MNMETLKAAAIVLGAIGTAIGGYFAVAKLVKSIYNWWNKKNLRIKALEDKAKIVDNDIIELKENNVKFYAENKEKFEKLEQDFKDFFMMMYKEK